jgi:hypothetical protein
MSPNRDARGRAFIARPFNLSLDEPLHLICGSRFPVSNGTNPNRADAAWPIHAADHAGASARRRGTALNDAHAIALETASATIIESMGLPGARLTAAVHSAP